MNKFVKAICVLLGASVYIISLGVFSASKDDASEADMLDVYLEQPESTRVPNPPSAQPQEVEFQKSQNGDGTVVYEVIPSGTKTSTTAADTPPEPKLTTESQPKVAASEPISNSHEVQHSTDLEVIELDDAAVEYKEVEAPVIQDSSTTVTKATPSEPVHAYCQKNPHAKECLYSKFATTCEKDPQSAKCKNQLKKFESFCETFPRAYKCKKAQMASTCIEKPDLAECKTISEKYCLKYPKAVFCDYN